MRQAYLVNTAENSALLLVVFFSPGTASASTLIVTGRPVGGVAASGMLAVAVSPAAIVGIVCVTTIGLPAPVIVSRTRTCFSSFSPWFITWTSKVVFGEALSGAAARGLWVPPPRFTVTGRRPVPCNPGGAVPLLPVRRLIRLMRSATVV